jgi:hypothetical protein
MKVIVKSAKKHCLIAEKVHQPTKVFKDKLQRINNIYSAWPVFALIICVVARILWLLV